MAYINGYSPFSVTISTSVPLTWSQYPAIANVNMAGYSINNLGSINTISTANLNLNTISSLNLNAGNDIVLSSAVNIVETANTGVIQLESKTSSIGAIAPSSILLSTGTMYLDTTLDYNEIITRQNNINASTIATTASYISTGANAMDINVAGNLILNASSLTVSTNVVDFGGTDLININSIHGVDGMTLTVGSTNISSMTLESLSTYIVGIDGINMTTGSATADMRIEAGRNMFLTTTSTLSTTCGLDNVETVAREKLFLLSSMAISANQVNLMGAPIVNLISTPTIDSEATSKYYVDSLIGAVSSSTEWSHFPAISTIDADNYEIIDVGAPTSISSAIRMVEVQASQSFISSSQLFLSSPTSLAAINSFPANDMEFATKTTAQIPLLTTIPTEPQIYAAQRVKLYGVVPVTEVPSTCSLVYGIVYRASGGTITIHENDPLLFTGTQQLVRTTDYGTSTCLIVDTDFTIPEVNVSSAVTVLPYLSYAAVGTGNLTMVATDDVVVKCVLERLPNV